jgi:regulator of replication initiation timing
VGDFAEHKEGFMDYLRNLSPVLALVALTSIVTGLTGWRKGMGYKELVEKEKIIDRNVSNKDVKKVRDNEILSDNDRLRLENKNLSENLNRSLVIDDNSELGVNSDDKFSEMKYKGKNKTEALKDLEKIKVGSWDEGNNISIYRIKGKFTAAEIDDENLSDIILLTTGSKVDYIDTTNLMGWGDGQIMIRLKEELSDFSLSKEEKNEIKHAIQAQFEKVINKDFENRWFKKGRASIAAVVSTAAGTASYFIWKDKFGELGSWVFGGCDKYVCNSTFLYGANSSESAIGMKADAIYQQIPFNDGSNNYIMNVVQVFSQNCAEMIKQSSESQTLVLYAGDSDINVGKHYLVSDVNNKLCPIGNMDMSKFIESVGATQ